MRTLLKRLLMAGYCRGWLPARLVNWAFRAFRLRAW